MCEIRGIWVALVTPFRGGVIDLDALRILVEQLLADGVAGFVVCGSTGEAAALSRVEQLAVLDAVLQWVPRERVIMGLAGNNLRELLAFQQEVERREPTAVLVPAPYYIRPSQKGLEAFFQTLADAARVPLVLYDIPYRTGVRFERETLWRIVRHPRIVAVKDCGGDLVSTQALIAGGQVAVLTGEDQQLFSHLCLGGAGAISASAHLRADLHVRLYEQLQQGELAAARQTYDGLQPWLQIAFAEPNPACIKGALAWQGLLVNELREPMQACSPEMQGRLGALVEQLRR